MKMIPEISLVLKENNKVLETVNKKTKTQPSELVKSLLEFKLCANAVLTKMIENSGKTGDMDVEYEDSEEEEENTLGSPKKKKK